MGTDTRFAGFTGAGAPRVAAALGVAGVALSCAVLAGYAAHVPALVTVLPTFRGMSPLTASGLLAASLAVLATVRGSSRLAALAGGFALCLGGATLAMLIVLGADEVSGVVASQLFGYEAAAVGRVSAATAAGLVAIGLAVVCRHRPRLSDGAGTVALVISGVAILGYAYGVQDLYALPIFNTMALHTALAVFGLGAATMLMRADSRLVAALDNDATGATRRQLAFTVFPPVLGWVLLRGVSPGGIGAAPAMAILVVLTVVPLAYLILRDGLVQAALDATREARAAELAAAMQATEKRLAERTAELQSEGDERLRAEAALARSQRLETVGQLTGGIAHDFNNLLMAVGGNLELALRRLEDGHPARRLVANAVTATDRGAKLTAQLLAFSRTQRLHIRPVELEPLLRQARELVSTSLGPTIDVELQLDTQDIWVKTDPEQLQLAIFNLAVNAKDAMHGSGRLTIESGRTRARLQPGGADTDFASIRVIDGGEGMTAAIAARAVEPFFTTKDRGKGTGLGLAQVYGFVQQCQGDLRITSAVGRGTTIEVLLPQVTAPAARAETAPVLHAFESDDASSAPRRLVLVIDDDDSVREVIVDALRGVGFDVVEARDGQEGLSRLDAMQPDAAIIDFIMPGMNGAEVARRARERRPDLPVVFVSGYFDTVALEGIAGAVVLRKPFDVAGLQRSVSSVLN